MAANQTYKPSEGKREEFRRYLEKTGVMDALTKVLVSLYEEPDKPNDALSYILNKLAVQCGGETMDSLKAQIAEANEKIDGLVKENSALKGEDIGEDQLLEGEAPPMNEDEMQGEMVPAQAPDDPQQPTKMPTTPIE